MKKRILYSSLALAMLAGSCTKNFDAINTDPNATSAAVFNPNFLLSQAQFDFANTGYGQMLFQSMWTQSLASTFSYYGNGDKYVASGSFVNYQGIIFEEEYRTASLVYEMQNLIKDKPEYVNLNSMGTLIKILCISKITDAYGDVPYSEALRAKEGVTLPKYDKQEDIYPAMLAEVESAVAAFSTSAPSPTGDIMFNGDIAKWKRFGNSLMLRLAMRLTKVDPAAAQAWAEKAAAGGTMSSIEDNAKVKGQQSTGYSIANANVLRVADDLREVRWSKTFIDALKAKNDPRLGLIGEVVLDGKTANSNEDGTGDANPALQIGMPNGYDLNGGSTDITNAPGYPGATGTGDDVFALGKYSRPRTALYRDRSGIAMIMGYAETELLLAEAKFRGWNVPGTAAEHYAKGVSAGIQTIGQFNAVAAVDAATADAYAAAHPLDNANALEQINTEYWIATGSELNFIEQWNNWRRSGFPVLTPVTYPGQFSVGQIPRRIPYASSEQSANAANYQDAVSRLSTGDDFTSRVWWDKP